MSSVKATATLQPLGRGRRTDHQAAAPVTTDDRATLDVSSIGSHSPSPIAGFRGANAMVAALIVAALSIGAGAIHLAVAGSHLGPLGDLALGFYWAAVFQITFALALLAHPGSRRLMSVGVGINVALIGAWAWSRTIGLPTNHGGPETIGIADATTVVFQVLLVSWLLTRLAANGTGPTHRRLAGRLGAIGVPVFVVAIAAVALATMIAVNDGVTGHGHDGHAPHAHTGDEPES